MEAESSKIGERMTPPMLWKAMLAAPVHRTACPTRGPRAIYLVSAYRDIVEDQAALEATLARLPGRHGRKRLAEWLDLARSGQFEALALATHARTTTTPLISAPAAKTMRRRLGVVEVEDLDPASQDAGGGEDRRARICE